MVRRLRRRPIMTTNTDTSTAAASPARARRAKATVDVLPPAAAPSKSDTVIKLLLRTKGATPVELIAATDWQPHSVRAFLSGLRKKGRMIVREPRKSGEFAYRIVMALAAEVRSPSGVDLQTEIRPTNNDDASSAPVA